MISEKLQNAINEQITAEMWSSNLYLSMSFYFACEGFDGFAHWMKKQSQEELEHAYTMADYVTKRGGKAKIDKIDVVPQGWCIQEEKIAQELVVRPRPTGENAELAHCHFHWLVKPNLFHLVVNLSLHILPTHLHYSSSPLSTTTVPSL